jgi:hypothetical protein
MAGYDQRRPPRTKDVSMLVETRAVSALAPDIRSGKLSLNDAAHLPELSGQLARDVISWAVIAVLRGPRRLEAGLDTLRFCRRLEIGPDTEWGEVGVDDLAWLNSQVNLLSRL